MHPKIKSRAPGMAAAIHAVKPLLLHDVTRLTASVGAASRRRLSAKQPASGAANHARHHVAPKSQS